MTGSCSVLSHLFSVEIFTIHLCIYFSCFDNLFVLLLIVNSKLFLHVMVFQVHITIISLFTETSSNSFSFHICKSEVSFTLYGW